MNQQTKKTVPGFEVTGECGRVWFVPMSKVKEDYIVYVMEADSLDKKDATKFVDENIEFLSDWFYDQFSWEDVDRCGKLIKKATPKMIQCALDWLRDGADVGRDVKETT